MFQVLVIMLAACVPEQTAKIIKWTLWNESRARVTGDSDISNQIEVKGSR